MSTRKLDGNSEHYEVIINVILVLLTRVDPCFDTLYYARADIDAWAQGSLQRVAVPRYRFRQRTFPSTLNNVVPL
jgi:hypothetical protein